VLAGWHDFGWATILARNDAAKENSGRGEVFGLTELAAGFTILYYKADSSILPSYSITDADQKGQYGLLLLSHVMREPGTQNHLFNIPINNGCW
jgi:hypothetical protein